MDATQRGRGASLAVCLTVGLALFISIFAAASASADTTTLLSLQSVADGGAAANENSEQPVASTDGRYVASISFADNLSTIDNDAVPNVYLRDTTTGTTTLVSRQSAADGGAGADDSSGSAAISADGRYVAFTSQANNLSTLDSNLVSNVYLRDTQTNTTTLVSINGAIAAADGSYFASISPDGRYVEFESNANNMSALDNDAVSNIYVRDTVAATTTLVSRRSAGDGGAGADGSSFDGSISSDGRYVAFASQADNLSAVDNNTIYNVFVRDTVANTITLVSRQSAADGGTGADGNSGNASISADGRYVAFDTVAANVSPLDTNSVSDVFLRDTTSNTTTLISRQSVADGGAIGDHESYRPSISADGRYIAFASYADNLSVANANPAGDIFRRDTATDTTALVSRQSAADGGAGGDAESDEGSISPDGRYVVFGSKANNLSALDDDAFDNVFLRDTFVPDAPPPPPPPPPPAADATPPVVDVSGVGKGKLGKPVKVEVSCDEACHVIAEGTVKPKGTAADKRSKALKLKGASADIAAGQTVILKLKPSKRTARKLKRAAKATAKISVSATDAAGNTAAATTKLKLR
jgi:Tol biopolymer transport system component